MPTGDVHRNQYDHIKCPCCGVPWPVHTDICCRHHYRPAPDPEPVDRARRRRHAWEERHGSRAPARPAAGTASSLLPSVLESETARQELEGGATREWAEEGKSNGNLPAEKWITDVVWGKAKTDPDYLYDK